VAQGACVIMSGPVRQEYKLNYKGAKLSEQDIENLPVMKEERCKYEEIDFSQNGLSSQGLRAVIRICKRCRNLRVLKLFKNKIDDEGAEWLAELCKDHPWLEEIHLSHNNITERGIERLVTAAENSRTRDQPPLWLRCEHNAISKPEEVFREMSRRLNICIRSDERRCTTRTCCNGGKVHLPFFSLQSGSGHEKGGGKSSWNGGGGGGWSSGYSKQESWNENKDWKEDRPKVVLLAARPGASNSSPPREARLEASSPARLQGRKRKASRDVERGGRSPPQRHRDVGARRPRAGSFTPPLHRRREHREERGAAERGAVGRLRPAAAGRARDDSRPPPARASHHAEEGVALRRRRRHTVEDPSERLRPGRPAPSGRDVEGRRRRADEAPAERRDRGMQRPTSKQDFPAEPRRLEHHRSHANGLGPQAAARPESAGDAWRRRAEAGRAAAAARGPEGLGVAAKPNKAGVDDDQSYTSSDEDRPPGDNGIAPQGRSVPGMAAPGSLLAGTPAQGLDDESSPTFSGSDHGGATAVPFAPDSPQSGQQPSPRIEAPQRLPSPSSESGGFSPDMGPLGGADHDAESPRWEEDRGCPPPSLSRSRSPVNDAAKVPTKSRMQQLK